MLREYFEDFPVFLSKLQYEVIPNYPLMNAELKKIIETQSRYIHISIPYYEDDYTYSFEDSDDIDRPLPLVTEDEKWEVTIDLKEHTLLEWKPEYGFCHVFAKVRDEGIYTLLNKDKDIICRLKGYVPNKVVPPKDGYDDYIGFDIEENGSVIGWYDTYDFSDFVENGKIINPEDMMPITSSKHIWGVLQGFFAPLSLKVFQELRSELYPHFSYSGEFAYLSKSKKMDEILSINVEKPINESEATLKETQFIELTKSLWLTFGVTSPKRRALGSQRFQIAYHIEFEADYYYLPIIIKKLPYGELPAQNEIDTIIQTLKDKAIEMLNIGKSGIVEF